MNRPPLDATAISDGLVGPGLAWRRIDVVDETGSTNTDLMQRSAAGEDVDGTVLLAEFQTEGRGRHGRHWSAPPRSQVALSVGVSADGVPTQRWGWLPLAIGVAVADALDGVPVGLKWPNDVMVGAKKLAGILAEVAAPKPVIVVGLGLNVTMTADEAPDPAATSLLMLNASIDRNALAHNIFREFAVRVAAWRAGDPQLVADYQRRCVTLGSRVRASLPGEREIVGIARAIDELGRLCIDTGGQMETVSAGDITHLRPST